MITRRRKDTTTGLLEMDCNSTPSRRKPTKLPVVLGISFSVAVVMFVAYMNKMIGTDLPSQDPVDNEFFRGKSKQMGVVANDKTYSNSDPNSDCSKFDHGDTTPAKDVKSLFNCNSEEGKCKWHFPAKFFDKTCGIGKDFVDEIEVLKDLHGKQELWLNGPPIVIPWAAITPSVTAHQFRKEPYPTHNLSMTHVHKTGGTSLVNAFGAILRKGAKGKRHTVYQPGKSGPMQRRPLGPSLNSTRKSTTHPRSVNWSRQYNASSRFLNGAVKYRSEWGPTDHTLFAVIRDPAERFISAIGQATGAYGSAMNGIGRQLLKECLKSTSKETLGCFVDLVKNNGTLIEVHFTPMVLEISFATMWKDIPVAVFPFTEVPALMNELGADPNSKKKDGHQKGYRKDPILTNMTIADYDNKTLKDLCEVYYADALFMHHLGYESRCDQFLLVDDVHGF